MRDSGRHGQNLAYRSPLDCNRCPRGHLHGRFCGNGRRATAVLIGSGPVLHFAIGAVGGPSSRFLGKPTVLYKVVGRGQAFWAGKAIADVGVGSSGRLGTATTPSRVCIKVAHPSKQSGSSGTPPVASWGWPRCRTPRVARLRRDHGRRQDGTKGYRMAELQKAGLIQPCFPPVCHSSTFCTFAFPPFDPRRYRRTDHRSGSQL